jgi:hypothetical protein
MGADIVGRLTCLVLLLLSAAAAATCGKDPVQPSQPSASCASIADSSRSIVLGPDASTFTVTVNAPAGCSWTTTVSGTFLTLSGGTSAQPRGTLEINASENRGAERTGTITVGNSTASVRQTAPACEFRVTPSVLSFPDNGGGAAIDVALIRGGTCPWTATSTSEFVTFPGAASGIGTGSLSVAVDPNLDVARVGQIAVAGQSVTVNQTGPCRYESYGGTTFNIPADGATEFWWLGPSAWYCSARVESHSAFIHARVNCADTGCQVTFTVDANPGPARTGTMTAGGITATINQAGR